MIKVLVVLGFCFVQAVIVGTVEGTGNGCETCASTSPDDDIKAYFSSMARGSVENVIVFEPPPNEYSLIAALGSLDIGFRDSDSAFDILFGANMGALSKSLVGPSVSWRIWVIKFSRDISIKSAGVNGTAPASSRRCPRIIPSDRKGICGGVIDIPNRSPSCFCGNNDIGPQLVFGVFVSSLYRSMSGFSGFLGLIKHPLGVFGGDTGFIKSAFNQPNSQAGNTNRYHRCDKHEFCPKGHIVLGFQILYLVLGGAFLLGGSLLIYKLADRGFDLTKRGSELLGWGSILLTFSLGPLLIGGFLTLGYGLVFENGWLLFLGQGQTGP